MSELQIENPTQVISYDLSWTDVKNHILKVITTFQKEYSIIKNETDKIVLLNIPIGQTNNAIAKDQILYIDNDSVGGLKTTVKIVITNEDNKISSYTEFERDKKSLTVFTILLKKSIEGTLEKSVANVNAKQKPKANPLQAILQLITLIVALVVIFYGIQALMN